MSWSDNIPEGGVVCKEGNRLFKIIAKYDVRQVREACGSILYTSGLTPITPQEWWELAPWNYDMDSTPKGEILLLKDIDGSVYSDQFLNKKWLNTNSCKNPIALIPLPEQANWTFKRDSDSICKRNNNGTRRRELNLTID